MNKKCLRNSKRNNIRTQQAKVRVERLWKLIWVI